MVKKTVGLSFIAVVLVCAAVGAICRLRRQCRDLTKHGGNGGKMEVLSPVEQTVEAMSANNLHKSPRSGQVYWGIGKRDGVMYDCAYRVQTPKRISITSEQSNMVTKVFASILEAYKRHDVERMNTAMKDVPDIVTNMQDKVFIQLSRPLSDALDEHFLRRQLPMEFSGVDELSAYLRSNLELTLFLGNVALAREDFTKMVDIYDALVLSQLLNYKTLYHEQRAESLEKCVDGFIEIWHRQIESEHGFTRQCMWYQVDAGWTLYHEGFCTLEQLTDRVKLGADQLLRLGYTPKWLSEFDDLSEAVK